MTAQQDIESVDRMLEKKQQIPSQMIRNLVIDCKSLLKLVTVKTAEIAALKSRIAELEAEQVQA